MCVCWVKTCNVYICIVYMHCVVWSCVMCVVYSCVYVRYEELCRFVSAVRLCGFVAVGVEGVTD